MTQDLWLSVFLTADRNLQTLQHKKFWRQIITKCIVLKPVIPKIKLIHLEAQQVTLNKGVMILQQNLSLSHISWS